LSLTARIIPRTALSRQVYYETPILDAATSTAPSTYKRSYIPPQSAANDELDRQAERLRRVVVASRLETVITNADTRRVVASFQKAAAFDASATFRRSTVLGREIVVPAAAMTRRWSTAAGRQNIAKTWKRRIQIIEEQATETSETVKLITLTFRGVESSWQGFGEIRAFINALSHWAKRQGCRTTYIWTAELQKRCALHYHLVVIGCPFISKARIGRMWRHGYFDVRAVSARKAAMYALKYVTKGTAAAESSQDLSALLFSAKHKRHFGCSRTVIPSSTHSSAWLDEILDLLDVTLEEVEIYEIEASTAIYIQLKTGETIWLDRNAISWRLTRRLETS